MKPNEKEVWEEAVNTVKKLILENFHCRVCKEFSKYNLVSKDSKICESCYKEIQEAWYEACNEANETLNINDFIDAYVVSKELKES